MIKLVQGWEISKNLEKKHLVYVRFFSSAKVICMKNMSNFFCKKRNKLDNVPRKVELDHVQISYLEIAISTLTLRRQMFYLEACARMLALI